MGADNYYELLGVSRFASEDTLKHAFRLRLLQVHPDRNPASGSASDETRRVIEAYHVLSGLMAQRQPPMAGLASVRRAARRHGPGHLLWAMLSKALVVLGCVGFVAYTGLAMAGMILADRTPVYRPFLAGVRVATVQRNLPVVAQPGLAECVEWYNAEVYRLSLGSAWASRQMAQAYSEAARRAAARGDRTRARFYRAALAGIRT